MRRLVIVAFAVAAVVALAAACGGDGDDGGGDAGAAAPNAQIATVSAEPIGDFGPVLVHSAGKALYAADEEAGGMVLCTGACESFWTPLTIDAGSPTGGVPGTLGVIERPDGTRQVTHDGRLLYSFTEDQPGQVTGDGFSDAFDGQQFTWHVVSVDGAAASEGGSGGTGADPLDYAP
jgi:predicted lipoprotein with Yx(FWY)xxD motif